jgi:hypothetical protein
VLNITIKEMKLETYVSRLEHVRGNASKFLIVVLQTSVLFHSRRGLVDCEAV